MAGTSRIKIDGGKLRDLILRRGVTLLKGSEEIGMEASYLSKCTRENLISRVAAIAIEGRFGIALAEYEVKPEITKMVEAVVEENKTVVEPNMFDDAFWEKLQFVIYEAVKKAWAE